MVSRLCGETLHISDVKVPVMAVRDAVKPTTSRAGRTAIAGFQMTKSKDRTFLVSESGHIAGIVNPPSKKKYGFYANEDLKGDAEAWMAGATKHPRRLVVAALGNLAEKAVGQAGSGARTW